MRLFLCFVPILALVDAVLAQPSEHPAVPVVKLTVHAAESPMPALRYELLPNFREQVPGNAALSYHRAILLLNEGRSNDPKKAREHDAKIDEMAAKPNKDINVAELREYLQSYRQVFRELEAGAKRDKCDWDLERRADADGIGMLLPEVQKMRELARLLSLRCRLQIAEGKIADALQDVQTGFAMARHVGEGPSLIQALVGMALFQIFSNRLEQIIDMPGSPNLYWALTVLPRPFQDMHKPLEGEARILDGTLPLLRDLERGPMSVQQVQKALDQWARIFADLAGTSDAEFLKSRLLLAGIVAMQLPRASQSLMRMGKTEAEVRAMPAGQVVLLDSALRFKGLRDQVFACFHLPYPESAAGLRNVAEQMRRMKKEWTADVFGAMLVMVFPAVEKVHFASVRSERKIACLRVIEALRMHAAASAGKFPARLAEISIVPVPADPVTGKPFEYELTGDGKALLHAGAAPGQQAIQGNVLKYELTLRK
jgi:hypothetical protein